MLDKERLRLRKDAVELHHDGFRKDLRPLLVLGGQRLLEPRNALLRSAHHPCSRDLQRLGHLSTHMKDAVFVLDQTHSKTHRLSHRLIPVRQDEAIELTDYCQEIRGFWMSGAPDTIRTCDLCLRRANVSDLYRKPL